MFDRGRSFGDRIWLNSLLIVFCFVSVLLLESQSAASYPTYILALLMLVTARQWTDVFGLRQTWLVLGLLCYLSASAFWSDPFALRDAVTVISRALLVFLFVVALAECEFRGQIRRWLGRALAAVGLLAVLAAVVHFHVTDPADGRLNGLGQLDSHVIAALVFGVVLIFLVDTMMSDDSRPWRLLAAVGIPLVIYAVAMSDSRNAWISAMLGTGVFVLARTVKDAQRFLAGVSAFAVVLAALLAALIAGDDTRDLILPRGGSFRLTIWEQIASRLWEGGIWLGLGINTSDNVFAQGMEFLHPHNLYLSVAYHGGIIGLALFAWLILSSLRILFANYHSEDAKLALGILALALPAYLLDGHELIDKVGSTWFLFWLPVGVSLGFAWRRRLQVRSRFP